jgi:hypothetical protein
MEKWCEWCNINKSTVFVARKYKLDIKKYSSKKFSGWVCPSCKEELEKLDKYCHWRKKTPDSEEGLALYLKLKSEKDNQARKDNNIIRNKYNDRIKCV